MPTTGNRSPIDPTPLYAVVGVTDLAVERVRNAQADAQRALSGFDAKSAAQEVPTRAVALALTAAGKAEQQYEELAQRGKSLYQRVRTQQSTQDLLSQAGNTLSRTKGAVTTARKAADDTATAVRGTLGVGRREAEEAAATTRRSAKRTTTRAAKNASATKSAAKGARTSATKTASKATAATKDAAAKTGD
jgi:heparin binding hemagglutinin HbhA